MASPEKIDLSKIKVGDEVAIRAWVTGIGQGFVQVSWCADARGSDLSDFTCQAIVSHTPKAPEVGDVVWGLATKRNGTVRATYQGLAWVEFEDGSHEIVFPDQVERAQ